MRIKVGIEYIKGQNIDGATSAAEQGRLGGLGRNPHD